MTVDKRVSYEMQGGSKPARNYLGKQKTVSNIPVKWKSGPDAPETELAYITKAEKDLLLKKNLHGSLKNGPNTGPDNIMSLDSQGDYTRDRSPGAYSGSGGSPAQQAKSAGTSQQALRNRAMNEQHMKDLLTGKLDHGQTTQTGKLTRKYSDLPEWMNVTTGVDAAGNPIYKRKHMASAYKSSGDQGFLGNLFSRGARGYRGIKGLPAWGDARKNYQLREGPEGYGYYTDKEDFGEMRDAFPAFGIMGIIKALANKFKRPPPDMTQFNALGAAQTGTAPDVPMASINRWTKPIERNFGDTVAPVPTEQISNNIFNYRDVLPEMVKDDNLSFRNFNVNQNYGKKDVLPHFNYGGFGASQNMIDPNAAYNYFNNMDNNPLLNKNTTSEVRIPPGNMRGMNNRSVTKAEGGRIGYRSGELVDEDINVEGPGFDVNENIEMAEEPSPFEMRIQELMDEGMSWQEAYTIASEEFSMAEGQDESFSEQGLASLV